LDPQPKEQDLEVKVICHILLLLSKAWVTYKRPDLTPKNNTMSSRKYNLKIPKSKPNLPLLEKQKS